jgi:hypothetical protein
MRKRNWRLVILGVLLSIMAAGFYVLMMFMAPSSTDPVTLMETAGGAAGTAIGVSFVIALVGLIGKKV